MEWFNISHAKAILRASPKCDWPAILTDLTNDLSNEQVTRFCELVRLFYFRSNNA